MPEKLDLRRSLDCYRAQVGRIRPVEVPRLQHLMIDGRGDPNGEAFAVAIAALYPLAYAIKLASKRELDRDYVVMPLEGLWWADDMDAFTSARDKAAWHWTLLMVVPDWIDAAALEAGRRQVAARGAPARLDDIRLEALEEGSCAQTLHIGAFDDEAPTLVRLHDAWIPERGLEMTGRHHEIYLSDARRVPPERRRTILRQPVRAATPGRAGSRGSA